MSGASGFENFAAFWPHYLREHSKPETRRWHIVGTGAGSVLAAAAFFSFSPVLLAAAVFVGYAPAWCAHFLVEKNRPTTWRHPLWSLRADYRMALLWLAGGLKKALHDAGI
jgi:hypothetical protein